MRFEELIKIYDIPWSAKEAFVVTATSEPGSPNLEHLAESDIVEVQDEQTSTEYYFKLYIWHTITM